MTRFQLMLLGSGFATVTAMIGLHIVKPGPEPVDPARWGTVEEPGTRVLFSGITPKEKQAYRPTAGHQGCGRCR